MSIEINMNQEFSEGLFKLANILRAWDKNLEVYLVQALQIIGNRWMAEAKKRVPVDFGRLRQGILTETYKEASGTWTCAVGTNVPYGKYVEFGTKYIAGGKVQALGDGIDITDAQAVHAWPAKNFGSGDKVMQKSGRKDYFGGDILEWTGWRTRGGFVNEKTGEANKRLVDAWHKAFDAGSQQEEMPWLRTSFNAIKAWAVEMLVEALRASGDQSRGAA